MASRKACGTQVVSMLGCQRQTSTLRAGKVYLSKIKHAIRTGFAGKSLAPIREQCEKQKHSAAIVGLGKKVGSML